MWEAHRRYADVQYVVTGREQLGVAPLEAMSETQPYDPERDVALYEGEGTLVALRPGSVAVLFPQEVHMPATPLGDPAEVRKVVIKVEVTSPGL
ncbi:MAG: YhcH/YjgK/YiaL family protein [Phycisphaeraceae bacterium]